MKHLYCYMALLIIVGCNLTEADLSVRYKNAGARASLTQARFENGKLVLEGQNLGEVTKVELKNSQGLNESLVIEEKTSSRLVAGALRAFKLTAGTVANLVVSNAHGATSFQIQVSLSDEEASAFLTRGDGAPDTASLSGTVSVDPAGTMVTGVGTSFLSELSRGDLVVIEGESSRVSSIVSDTSMVISKAHVAGAYGVSATFTENPVDVKDKAGNQILALNNSGYLGIFRGTNANGKPSSPLGALHIANGASQLIMTDTDDPIGPSNSHWFIRPNDSGASSFWIGAANDELESLAGYQIYMKFSPHTAGGGVNNGRVTIGSVEQNGRFNVLNQADQIGATIKGVAGQTQDLLQIRSSGSGVGDLFTVAADGSVGIGASVPGYALEVNGSVAGVGPYQDLSDERYKKNLEAISSPIQKLSKLNGYYYDWRQDEFPEKRFNDKRDIGVLAQEVEKVFPEAVQTNKDGYKTVAYARLVAPLIEAVKEIERESKVKDREIKRLRAEQFLLKKQMEEFKEELARLKKE